MHFFDLGCPIQRQTRFNWPVKYCQISTGKCLELHDQAGCLELHDQAGCLELHDQAGYLELHDQASCRDVIAATGCLNRLNDKKTQLKPT